MGGYGSVGQWVGSDQMTERTSQFQDLVSEEVRPWNTTILFSLSCSYESDRVSSNGKLAQSLIEIYCNSFLNSYTCISRLCSENNLESY